MQYGTDFQFTAVGSFSSGTEFVWNFGRTTAVELCHFPAPAGCGTEYKVGGDAATGGVAAYTAAASSFTPATVDVNGGGNTFITVP